MGGEGAVVASDGLKIVQVVRRMHPYGGAGGVAHALDLAFRAQGVRAATLTLEDLRPARVDAARGGRWRRAADVVAFTVLATRAIRRADEDEAAVVLVHGDALGGDIYVDHGLHKAVLTRRPWLWLHPLHVFIWAREELRHGCGAYLRLVCLSGAGEAALHRAYPRARAAPVARLPNGVDLERFRPEPSRMARPLGAADARLVFVGHEFGRKGLRHVIAALPRLPEGVRLIVVGGGDAESARRRAGRLGVAHRVDLLGARRDVADILRTCDLLVLPSAYEAFPLVALEAMASGLPVLLGAFPGAGEILGEGGWVTACSGGAVAAAVQALMNDPDVFVRLRRRAWEHAQGFAWSTIAAGYIGLAEEVRRARGARP